MVFSPDGKRLASAGADATVKIWNPLTGRELLSLPADKLPHEIRFAPDGNRLICVSSEAVRSWNAAELTEKH